MNLKASTSNKKIVYHFCPWMAFNNIIETDTFWFGDITHSNDPSENTIFIKRLAELKNLTEEEVSNRFKFNSSPLYILSFSSNELIQNWREYGDNGYGFALGIDKRKFVARKVKFLPDSIYFLGSELTDANGKIFSSDVFYCADVIYDEDIQKETSSKFLKKFPLVFSDDIRQKINQPAGNMMHERNTFYALSSLFKHSTYSAEYEFRVYRRLVTEIRRIENKENIITKYTNVGERKYFKSSFDNLFENNKDALAEVVIGPKNKTSIEEATNFLVQNGYNNCVVRKSEIPMR